LGYEPRVKEEFEGEKMGVEGHLEMNFLLPTKFLLGTIAIIDLGTDHAKITKNQLTIY